MPGAEIIKSACGQILVALKEGRFTQDELEFMIKLFSRIIGSSEKLLRRSPNKEIQPRVEKHFG